MAHQIFKARLSALSMLTPTVRELVIEFTEPLEMPFRAGQFVMLHIPQDAPDKPIKRAYSVASIDRVACELKLVIKHVPGGVASEYIAKLQTGSELELTGPFGKLFFQQPPTEQVIFLCTGAGISQHLSFLMSNAPNHKGSEYHLLFGVWNEDEIFYEEKIKKAQKVLPNFTYEYVLDKPIKDWSGKTGYVTDYIEPFGYMTKETTFYLCGNPAMIKSVKAHLEEKGFPKERIFAEAFH